MKGAKLPLILLNEPSVMKKFAQTDTNMLRLVLADSAVIKAIEALSDDIFGMSDASPIVVKWEHNGPTGVAKRFFLLLADESEAQAWGMARAPIRRRGGGGSRGGPKVQRS